jgi:hypothetical protein
MDVFVGLAPEGQMTLLELVLVGGGVWGYLLWVWWRGR